MRTPRPVSLAMVALTLGAITACNNKPPGAASPGPAPRSAPRQAARVAPRPDAQAARPRVASSPETEDRFRCAKDADCITDCALGAVRRAWWTRHGKLWGGCEDGCASKGYFARCVDRACVTFRKINGPEERVPGCTNLPLPPRPRPRESPHD